VPVHTSLSLTPYLGLKDLVAYVCHGVNGEAKHSRESHNSENGSNLRRMLCVEGGSD
jgi:hypothetical protein